MLPVIPLPTRFLLVGVLLLGAAACGGSRPPGSADSSPATAGSSTPTSTADTTGATSGVTTPTVDRGAASSGFAVADGELPGEPFDFEIPRAGDRMAVVGVAHDDVLNLRALPGANQPIVERVGPLTAGTPQVDGGVHPGLGGGQRPVPPRRQRRQSLPLTGRAGRSASGARCLGPTRPAGSGELPSSAWICVWMEKLHW